MRPDATHDLRLARVWTRVLNAVNLHPVADRLPSARRDDASDLAYVELDRAVVEEERLWRQIHIARYHAPDSTEECPDHG